MPDKKKAQVFLDICLTMPKIGDTSILCVNNVLGKHGIIRRRANATYNQHGGLSFHLLKERNHKLVINIKLGDLRHGTGVTVTSYFISWDGKTLWDHPDSLRVNHNNKQATAKECNQIFKKLYKKQGLSCQITNIYQLARQINDGEPLLNNEGSRGVTQNNCNFHTSLLVSLLDNQRISLLATQYSSTQRNCRPTISPRQKDKTRFEG